MSTGPVFVVVGHVNRGKSSIVSTLAADDSVHIAPEPGTTVHNRSFPMRIDGQTLYTLIDTPGFERARQVLDWLRDNEKATSARNQAVQRFLDRYRNDPRFAQECRELFAKVWPQALKIYHETCVVHLAGSPGEP